MTTTASDPLPLLLHYTWPPLLCELLIVCPVIRNDFSTTLSKHECPYPISNGMAIPGSRRGITKSIILTPLKTIQRTRHCRCDILGALLESLNKGEGQVGEDVGHEEAYGEGRVSIQACPRDESWRGSKQWRTEKDVSQHMVVSKDLRGEAHRAQQ